MVQSGDSSLGFLRNYFLGPPGSGFLFPLDLYMTLGRSWVVSGPLSEVWDRRVTFLLNFKGPPIIVVDLEDEKNLHIMNYKF